MRLTGVKLRRDASLRISFFRARVSPYSQSKHYDTARGPRVAGRKQKRLRVKNPGTLTQSSGASKCYLVFTR